MVKNGESFNGESGQEIGIFTMNTSPLDHHRQFIPTLFYNKFSHIKSFEDLVYKTAKQRDFSL